MSPISPHDTPPAMPKAVPPTSPIPPAISEDQLPAVSSTMPSAPQPAMPSAEPCTMPPAKPSAMSHQPNISNTTVSLNSAQDLFTKICSITELLEGVLLQLPPRDVLLTQRVCRRWKAVIDCSAQLQQALWFKPLASTSQVHFEAGPDHWASALEPGAKKLVFESPLLSSSMDDQPRLRGSGLPEASWRRQLIAQPPLEKCQVIHHTLTHHEETDVTAIDPPGGVMMGQITGHMEASEWYRGGLTVDGWRTWRTCLDVWMTLPACDFLKFLERSMEEEND